MVGCPTCGAELTYIEQYGRNYCNGCRSYAPREIHPCATCDRALVFVPQYGKFYCYGCQEYREGSGGTHACPTCGGELEVIPQYGRLFCYNCNEYAPEDPAPGADLPRDTGMTESTGTATGYAPFSREEMDLAPKDQLIQWCKEYGLDESGMKYELRLRLLEHIRRQGLLLKGEEALEEEGAPPPGGEGAAAASAVQEAPPAPGATGETGVELAGDATKVGEEAVCQNCGGDLTYIPQYDRWYCYNCDTYAPSDLAVASGHPATVEGTEGAFSRSRGRAGGNAMAGVYLAFVGLVMFIAHQILYIGPGIFPIPVVVTAPEISFGLSFLGPVFVALGLIASVLSLRPRG